MRITESQLRSVVRRLVLEQTQALPKTAQELSDMLMSGLKPEYNNPEEIKKLKGYAKRLFDMYTAETANPPKEGVSTNFRRLCDWVKMETTTVPQAYLDHANKYGDFLDSEKQRKADRATSGAAARKAAFDKNEAGPRFTQADVPQLKALIDDEGEPSPGIQRRFNGAVRADFKFKTNYLLDDLVALGFDKGAVSDLIDETEEALGLGYGPSGYYGSYSGATRDQRRSRGQV